MDLPMRDRLVLAVPLHLMLQGSIERVVDACNAAQRLYNTVDHARDPQDVRRHALQIQTQLELIGAGVDGIGGAWGPDPFQGPPPPRYRPELATSSRLSWIAASDLEGKVSLRNQE